MKRIVLSLVAIAMISLSAWGQAPEGVKYQAVVRNASNTILTNQAVGMRMTIQQGSIGGATVYQETFAATTNTYGLVNFEIGTGTVVSGDFTTIDWASGPYFIETATDVTGGVNYVVMGTSELMSVPYALYAKEAETVTNDNVNDADADPANEFNTGIALVGTSLETTDGGGTIITDLSSLVEDADADPLNEVQELTFSNDTLYLSNGGLVYLGVYAVDNVDDADADPTNEMNTSVLLNGTDLEVTDGNGTIITDLSSLQDGTGTDDQNMSGSVLSGTDLTIGIEGGTSETVDLSSLQDGTGTDDQNISGSELSGTDLTIGIEGGTSETVDLSSLQDGTGTDSQTLSFTSPNLTITGGNSVDLSGLTDDDDWVVSSGTNYTNGNDGNIGIGNIASTQNRWQLTVKDTVDCMLGADSVDVSELFGVFTRNLNENNTGVGIGFQSTSTVTGMGAAIVHERTNSNSRGKLHFATKSSGSAADEDLPIRMTLSETGSLGIGTTSPTEMLHLSGGDGLLDRGASTSSLTRSLTLGGARNGDSNYGSLDFQNYDSDTGTEYVGASIRSNNGGDATENGHLKFMTYNGALNEAMRIDESGFIGIGETTPQTSLDVADYAVIGNLAIGSESTDQGTSNASGLGYTTTPWLYTNAIEAQGERGTGSTLMTLGADGTYGVADEIHFVTSGNDQMHVASNGRIGIDVATPNSDIHLRQSQQSIANGTGGITFENSSDAADYWRVYHSGIYFSFNLQGSRVAYVNTTGAWTIDSDRRLKYGIEPLKPVLERVMQLKTVDYWYNEQSSDEKKVIGFVAQEVQPLFPEIVVESEEDKLGITYGATGVIAIKAIQEQQEIIEEQKGQIEKLQNQMLLLQKQMEELMKKEK